jgi:shikimate kinase
MGKYILIGIPNSGKSTLGRRAADALTMPFYDTDKLAYDRLDFENPLEIFLSRGAERFTAEQYAVMGELAELDGPAIIETWPESVLWPKCVELIKRMGTVIYVKRETDAAVADVKKDDNRMVLREVNTGHEIDMRAEAVKLYARDHIYFEALADLILENSGNEDDALKTLVSMIRERETQCL